MTKYISMFLLAILLFSCKRESLIINKIKTVIDVEYTTDIKPDSIIVTEKECIHWHSFKSGEPIKATFNKNVPHIYMIAFYTNGKHYTNEFWLNNGNPKVKLHFTNKQIVIDTVYDAPVYYEYSSFFKQLDVFDKTKNSVARDKYLLDKIELHYNDCFSNLVSAKLYDISSK